MQWNIIKKVMSVFCSGNFVSGYRHMFLLSTIKIFDRKYGPATWNFQETDLFFVKIGMQGCNKKKRPENVFESFLIVCCGVIFGTQKSKGVRKH